LPSVLVSRSKSAACNVPGCRAVFRRVANWVSIESMLRVIIGSLPHLQQGYHHNAAADLTTSSLAVGVDVGGSSIKCALIDLNTGAFAGERYSTPTPAQGSTDALLSALASVVANIPGEHAVGLAFPSVIRNGMVRTAANLNKAWIGQPLADLAAKRLQRPVVAINDADAAGLAELRYGAAGEVPGTVLVLTLGTGIGSALFVDGQLVPNTEFGHLEVKGREAEKRASGRAKVEGGLGWDLWAAELNLVINELHGLLWPDLIVLCGGITEAPDKFMDKLQCEARLCVGTLRAEAGIVGAALATIGSAKG
jgi:polyphosphate glucokinase